MKIFGLNVRGRDGPAKYREISCILCRNKVDLFGLLDTRLKHAEVSKLLDKWFRDCLHCTNHASMVMVGIWLIWRDTIQVEVLTSSSQCVHCKV